VELSLREAWPTDRAACARLFAAVQPLAYPAARETATAADFEASSRGEDLWIAESSGQLVGMIAIWRPASFIHHLYVAPGWQRRGIGRDLLSLGLRACGGSAELKCNEANRAAQAFYMAAGGRAVDWGLAPSGPWIRYTL
jgi:ribosomal protein S18 acetylase RimI-like enzyme